MHKLRFIHILGDFLHVQSRSSDIFPLTSSAGNLYMQIIFHSLTTVINHLAWGKSSIGSIINTWWPFWWESASGEMCCSHVIQPTYHWCIPAMEVLLYHPCYIMLQRVNTKLPCSDRKACLHHLFVILTYKQSVCSEPEDDSPALRFCRVAALTPHSLWDVFDVLWRLEMPQQPCRSRFRGTAVPVHGHTQKFGGSHIWLGN